MDDMHIDLTPEPLAQAIENEDQSFAIRDDSTAEWAVRKIIERRAECQRMVDACDAEIERYKQVKDSAQARCAHYTAYLEGCLYSYMAQVKTRHTSTQTIYDLPSGKLVIKRPAPKLCPKDEQALVQWLKQSRLQECVEERPRWAEVRARIQVQGAFAVDRETGEIVPGVSVEEQPEVFGVQERR